MKERIKELVLGADLAGKVQGILVQNHGRWHDLTPHIEKFAELLIKESISVLENSYPPDDCVPIAEVAACLKEHFGIIDDN